MSRLIALILFLGIGSQVVVPAAYMARSFMEPAAVLLLAFVGFWIIARSAFGPRS